MSLHLPRGSALASIAGFLIVLTSGCTPCPQGGTDNPEIIPGRSIAGIEIGLTFERMSALSGEPKVDGLTFSYDNGVGGTVTDANGNGRADGPDVVVGLTADEPYRGRTAGGNGVGSSVACVVAEFGQPDQGRGVMRYEQMGIAFAVVSRLTEQVPPFQVLLSALTRQPVSVLQVTVFAKSEGLTLSLAVTPRGGGTVELSPARNRYDPGQEVELTATPQEGLRFDHWEGLLEGNENPGTLTMTESGTVTAVFALTEHTVTTAVSPDGAGSVQIQPEQETYVFGSVPAVLAVGEAGFQFDHWEGDLEGQDNPAALAIDGNKSITAVFVPAVFSITTAVAPEGAGTVTLEPAGPEFGFGDEVTATAKPAEGFAFDHWEGSLISGENPLAITVDGSKSITAVFAAIAAVGKDARAGMWRAAAAGGPRRIERPVRSVLRRVPKLAGGWKRWNIIDF